ncbi:hypothetical protein Tco_1360756, partial [Tanacetum coccineum]
CPNCSLIFGLRMLQAYDRNRSQLINFVHKFLGTVRFGNDQIAKIVGYDDYQMGNIKISQVYYVEGLGHNLFSVGQFCDSDIEVAFRKHTCYIRDLEGVDLLKGSRGSNLYTLSLEEMMLSYSICLLSKASNTKSWLWHRRLVPFIVKGLTLNDLQKCTKDNTYLSPQMVTLPHESFIDSEAKFESSGKAIASVLTFLYLSLAKILLQSLEAEP